jgi:hypothetical protein
VPVEGALGHPKNRCGLVHCQAGEVSQQDNLELERVTRFEFVQGFMNREHFVGRRLQDGARLVEFLTVLSSAVLCGVFSSDVFDQDVAHRAGGGKEEVLSAFKGQVIFAGDPQIGFVHQCGGRQSLAGGLPRHPRPRELVQLGIDERQELRRRLSVPGLSRPEHDRDAGVARQGHRCPSN